MEPSLNYIDQNRNLWNERTDYHFNSRFYDLEGFLKGSSSLNDIELDLLGNVEGKTILHLQCHFGQDTLSLARMGAITTGIDLSENAIGKARELAEKLRLSSRFICCNIYDLHQHLHEKFDIVFTSYGTINWLPDLQKWGKLISDFLKPGGKLVFAEFHPVVWMFDSEFKKIECSYFNEGEIVEKEQGTYADNDAPITLESITWNHSIGEVFQALTDNNLHVTDLKEYDYSPYDCFKYTQELTEKKFIIKHLGNKLPMVYSIVAVKKPGEAVNFPELTGPIRRLDY